MKHFAAALFLLFSTINQIPALTLTMWQDHPAPDNDQPGAAMKQGFPIGNGRMGGMVMGSPDKDRFQFNVDSLWTGNGTCSEKDYRAFGAYQAFGDVFIDLPGHVSVSGYRRELNLRDAVASVSYVLDGTTFKREYIASHPAGVVIIRLTASQPRAYTGAIRLRDAHGGPISSQGDQQISAAGTLQNGLKYESAILVLPEGGSVKIDAGSGNAPQIDFRDCDALTVILAAGTSYLPDLARGYNGEAPRATVLEQVQAAAAKSYEQLKTEHTNDFHAFFDSVSLDLGSPGREIEDMPTDERITAAVQHDDPELAQLLFQYGRYNLISCSRDALPANLQGLWNDTNNPQWACDYHVNINLQMNYWPAEPAGLGACHPALFNWIDSMLDSWRKNTQADPQFQLASGSPVRGWAVRTMLNPFGGGAFIWDKTANAWLCQHYWEHYAFGGDRNFLLKSAYPVMKETCQFWEDHLKTLPDGTLVVPNGWSPEHGPHEDGVSYNQEIVWDLFDNYVKAAETLGIDQDYRSTILRLRDHLALPKIGRWGQLQEWMEDRDDPRDPHRHTSHLFAVYPGHQISFTTTPELAAAARKSLEARGESGDSRRQWVWAWRAALWARLGDAEKAHDMIVNFFRFNMQPNLIGTHPPQQWDGNFGITAAMCEMLMQSQSDEIVLLPALPEAWTNGEVHGLRARGGFSVDISWHDHKLTGATIRSTWGTNAVVCYGDKKLPVHLQPGGSLQL